MEKTPTATVTPAECLTCERAEGPFVDTLREEHRGRVYICQRCVLEMARLLDVGRDDRKALDAMERERTHAIKALEQEVIQHEELRKGVVLMLRQGAVTREGRIQLRQRPTAGRG